MASARRWPDNDSSSAALPAIREQAEEIHPERLGVGGQHLVDVPNEVRGPEAGELEPLGPGGPAPRRDVALLGPLGQVGEGAEAG